MKKLAIIALVCLGVAVIALIGAAAIGAKKLKTGDFDLSFLSDREKCAALPNPAANRSLKWDGGDEISIEVPATVHYTAGQGDMVVLKGDPQFVGHVLIEDGTIKLDCRGLHGWRRDNLDITLPGREFKSIEVAGSVQMDLNQLKQDSLKIEVAGSADVTANGAVNNFELSIAGSGDVKAKDLAVKKLDLNIAGRGDVETAPQDNADISIAGSGDVKLYAEPKHLDTSIMGHGNVEHLAAQHGADTSTHTDDKAATDKDSDDKDSDDKDSDDKDTDN